MRSKMRRMTGSKWRLPWWALAPTPTPWQTRKKNAAAQGRSSTARQEKRSWGGQIALKSSWESVRSQRRKEKKVSRRSRTSSEEGRAAYRRRRSWGQKSKGTWGEKESAGGAGRREAQRRSWGRKESARGARRARERAKDAGAREKQVKR